MNNIYIYKYMKSFMKAMCPHLIITHALGHIIYGYAHITSILVQQGLNSLCVMNL